MILIRKERLLTDTYFVVAVSFLFFGHFLATFVISFVFVFIFVFVLLFFLVRADIVLAPFGVCVCLPFFRVTH